MLKQDSSNSKINSAFRLLVDILEIAAAVITAITIIFSLCFQIISVEGISMVPTFHENDKLFISNLFYTPKASDFVIFSVSSSDTPYLKRVIATEGQTVDFDEASFRWIIDGIPLDEPYINDESFRRQIGDVSFPQTVPKGHLFVLGDNRNYAVDSRFKRVGMIPTDHLHGRVIFFHAGQVE